MSKSLPCREAAAGLPLLGTAPRHTRLLLAELPTPWPRVVATSPHWPQGWGGLIKEQIVQRRPVSVHGIHQPGRSGNTRALFAFEEREDGGIANHWEVPRAEADDALCALIQGQTAGLRPWARPFAPALFVCTHGERDACCGEVGTALAAAFTGDERVWHVSHLGGHRYAPTALLWPGLSCWGRLTEPRARELLACGGDLTPLWPHYRGRTTLPQPSVQAAEQALWAKLGWPWDREAMARWQLEPLGEGGERITFFTADGTFAFDVARSGTFAAPASCGSNEEKAVCGWRVTPA